MTKLEDLRPPWQEAHRELLNIIRRFQSVARSKLEERYAVLTIKVLVNTAGNPAQLDGKPLIWTEPEVLKLEPRRAEVVEILRQLT